MKTSPIFAISAFTALALAFVATATARDASEVQPLLIGAAVPDVSVVSESGKSTSLTDLTTGKNTVLVFYRGGWCPYCNTQLQGLAESEAKLIELGYQVIAISPDSPDHLKSVEKDGAFHYQLFSDSHFAAIDAFNIGFTLSPEMLAKYKGYGIDLANVSGGANPDRLPVPAVFLIGPDNVIRFSYVNPDITTRISSKLLIAAAESSL